MRETRGILLTVVAFSGDLSEYLRLGFGKTFWGIKKFSPQRVRRQDFATDE